MRARRAYFLAIAAGLLVAALYTGEKIYYLALFIMAGMVLLSLITALITYYRLNYLQTLTPSSGIKGKDVTLRVEIHNDYLFPFPLVVLSYDLPENWLSSTSLTDAVSVLPRSRYELTRRVRCRYRGRYPVGLRSARFTDLFGLYAFTIRFDRLSYHRPLTLLVRPRIVPLSRLPLPVRESEGQVRTRMRVSDDMTQMAEPRKYRAGDPLKKVHWKLTARNREIIVKDYEQSSRPQITLYLDTRKTGLPGIEGVALEDMLVECATAVANHVIDRGYPFRLIAYAPDRRELAASRPGDFAAVYELLSDIAFTGEYPLHDVLTWELKHIGREGCLFIVAQDITASAFDTLMLLRHSGVLITVIWVYSSAARWSSEAGRMVREMRDKDIPVLTITPQDDLAVKAEALR
jgi:uncharacterized protein (DUF58 family)